jgi:hypothetical protein
LGVVKKSVIKGVLKKHPQRDRFEAAHCRVLKEIDGIRGVLKAA